MILLTGCQTTNPWAGFPPHFKTPEFNAYRAEYLSDIDRFKADPAGFLGSDSPGLPCDMSLGDQKAFASTAFIRDLKETGPDYKAMLDEWNAPDVPPVFDKAEVRLLDGACVNGRIEGNATVHVSVLAIRPHARGIKGIYRTSEFELKEICSYREGRREGICRRYSRQIKDDAYLDDDGRLERPPSRVPEDVVIFDYGAYADGLESGPGVRFQTYKYAAGPEMNLGHTRQIHNGSSLRYDEFSGDSWTKTHFRRLSDRKLHGPVYWGNHVSRCYEAGEEVKRAECREP